MYWYLEFEAKRLCGEAGIRGVDGDEFATGKTDNQLKKAWNDITKRFQQSSADHGAVDFARHSVLGCSDGLGCHCCKPQTAFLSLSVHARRDAAENAPITFGWDRIICFHEV